MGDAGAGAPTQPDAVIVELDAVRMPDVALISADSAKLIR
jgi:hypothetical protein